MYMGIFKQDSNISWDSLCTLISYSIFKAYKAMSSEDHDTIPCSCMSYENIWLEI